jgi:hypothetical protein
MVAALRAVIAEPRAALNTRNSTQAALNFQ